MISKLKSFVKEPAFWVVLVTVAIAVAAFSKLRGIVKPLAGKIPGNDVQG